MNVQQDAMPVISTPLREFLRTGTLDGIAVGTAVADVVARLGPPPEDTKLSRGIFLWAYGGRLLQVTFDRGRVLLIGLYPRYASGTSEDPLAGGFPPIGKDRATFMAKLEEWKIPFSDSVRFPGMYEVGAQGVLAVFDDDGVLESLQMPDRTPFAPSEKRGHKG